MKVVTSKDPRKQRKGGEGNRHKAAKQNNDVMIVPHSGGNQPAGLGKQQGLGKKKKKGTSSGIWPLGIVSLSTPGEKRRKTIIGDWGEKRGIRKKDRRYFNLGGELNHLAKRENTTLKREGEPQRINYRSPSTISFGLRGS